MDTRTAVARAEAAALAFAALGSPTRLAILRVLVRAGPEGLPVGGLQTRLEMAGSTLSHHLTALERAGLLSRVRDGRSLICRAHFELVEGLAAYLIDECCADSTRGKPR